MAVAGLIYNLCANHTSNSGFDRTFMLCSGYFYALPNNQGGTKYSGLTYSAKQNCPWICKATYSGRQTRLWIWSVSLTVVWSIKRLKTSLKHPKPPPSCRTATLDFFSIWLNLKSQCFCALSWPVMESPSVLRKTRFLDNPTIQTSSCVLHTQPKL